MRVLRCAAGLSQSDLSVKLELETRVRLTQSDISEIERGTRGLKDTELVAIAHVLGCSMDEILGASG